MTTRTELTEDDGLYLVDTEGSYVQDTESVFILIGNDGTTWSEI